MTGRHVLIAAAALLASAAPAFAQPQRERGITAPEARVRLGSRIPRWEQMPIASERDTALVLQRFGRCISLLHPRRATALLAAAPGSQEMVDLGSAMIRRPTRCLAARRMRFNITLFRGTVAEAFLGRREAAARAIQPAPAPSDFAAFAARLVAADRDGVDERERPLVAGRWVATCLAHERPEIVRSVLAASPASPEENRVLREAEAAFGSCLPEGQGLTVDQFTIRALLAEAFYLRLLTGGV